MVKLYRIYCSGGAAAVFYRAAVGLICLLAIKILNLKVASVLPRQPSPKNKLSLDERRQDV